MVMAPGPLLDLFLRNNLSRAQIIRTITKVSIVVLAVFLSDLPQVAAADNPAAPLTVEGTYTFLTDSDGAKAPGSVQISVTFGEGKVLLNSAPADPRYKDEGSYEFKSGTLVKLVLPHVGKFVAAGKVLRQENTLIIPFKLLSGGAGTSTWKIPACRAESIQPLLESIIKKTEQRIPFEVQAFLRQSIRPGPDGAVDYMRLGTSISMAGYATEAVWLLAQAAKMTEDPHVLNNLAHALNKEGPGKGGPGDSGEADKPPGRDDEGEDLKPPASNEDEGMENVPDADPDSTIIGQIGKRDREHDQKPPKPFEFPSNPKPLAELSKAAGQWGGHWEGYKVTGCIKRTRDFGSGLAKTRVKENICHYAKSLSFDVDEHGKIKGEGEVLYP